ncbi:hypothetical protein AB9E07_35950, partial [Rhizobium leguminosarum]
FAFELSSINADGGTGARLQPQSPLLYQSSSQTYSAALIFAVYLKWMPALSFANEVHSLTDLLSVYAMPVITLTFVVSAQ